MRAAFVAPRYGDEIVGGAEAGMRMIAERLATDLGWRVEALTSCSSDYMSWENDLPEGESVLNGVRVRRFPSLHPRTVEFDILTDRLLADPARAGVEESDRWVDLQGPHCPELIEALAACDADVVCLSPYLYHPAVRGIEVVARRSVFHPAAHDEPPIYLPVFREVFLAAAGLVYYGSWERGFVERLFGVAGKPQLTLGLGIDDPDPASVAAATAAGLPGPLGDRPYLCCLGRVDAGKGTTELASLFAEYKERHPSPLALAIVGPVVHEPPAHPDVVVLGQVDEAEKWALIDGSIGLVSPSRFESFGLVLLEAWVRRRPVLVNSACGATSEHVGLSGGGLSYGSPAEFEAAVDRLAGDAELRSELGEAGRSYVDDNFRWRVLIERWARFAEEVAARAA